MCLVPHSTPTSTEARVDTIHRWRPPSFSYAAECDDWLNKAMRSAGTSPSLRASDVQPGWALQRRCHFLQVLPRTNRPEKEAYNTRPSSIQERRDQGCVERLQTGLLQQ